MEVLVVGLVRSFTPTKNTTPCVCRVRWTTVNHRFLKGWGLDLASMENALAEARRSGITVRALVFINPGNPTGNCLTVPDLQQLVRFAYNNG